MSVDIVNESGAPTDEHALVTLARHVLDQMGAHPQATMTIALVGVDTMAALHKRWMDEPGPTDVLSFPDEHRSRRDDAEPEPGELGEVVLCPAVAATQAVEHGRTMEQELDLLLTHGILHLLGFDHAEPEEEREMFGLQDSILGSWTRPASRSGGGG